MLIYFLKTNIYKEVEYFTNLFPSSFLSPLCETENIKPYIAINTP